MIIKTELQHYALTPSGTGTESFKLKEMPGRRTVSGLRFYSLTFVDEHRNSIEIRADELTLHLLKEWLP